MSWAESSSANAITPTQKGNGDGIPSVLSRISMSSNPHSSPLGIQRTLDATILIHGFERDLAGIPAPCKRLLSPVDLFQIGFGCATGMAIR